MKQAEGLRSRVAAASATRLAIASLLGMLLLSSSVARAAPSDHYAYGFALHTKADAPAYRLRLPLSVYAHSLPKAKLRDLIVVNANGQEVPLARRKPAATEPLVFTKRLPFILTPVQQLPATRNDDTKDTKTPAPSWLLDSSQPIHLEQIQLLLPAELGELQWTMALASSNDLQHWTHLRDVSITRLQSGSAHIDQQRIPLIGKPAARYYQLRLLEGQQKGATLTDLGALIRGHIGPSAMRPSSPLQWLTLEATSKAAGHDFDYSLPAELPLSAVNLALSRRNNAAHLVLSAADTHRELVSVSITSTRQSANGITLHVNSRRVGQLHLHSNSRLSAPPRLRVGWRPAEFVFLAKGPAPYRLLAGSYQKRRSDYPIDAALNALQQTHGNQWQPAIATLGKGTKLAGAAALKAPPQANWPKWLLWGLLGLAVLLVISMAWSLLRQNKTSNSPP